MGKVRARGVGCAPPSRAGALPGAAAARRSAVPASHWPVVARRHASLRHGAKPISAGDPSNGADDRITAQDHRKGRSRWSRLRFARKARSPLTVILPGKTIGTYQRGRGSAVAPATRAKRAIVARAA